MVESRPAAFFLPIASYPVGVFMQRFLTERFKGVDIAYGT